MEGRSHRLRVRVTLLAAISIDIEHDWLDYLLATVGMGTLMATVVGLYFVARGLRQSVDQQRVGSGPFVRVDVGSTDEDMGDFKPPAVHYHSVNQAVEVGTQDESSRRTTLTAWFRNYQTHPLGMALGVTAVFLVETDQ